MASAHFEADTMGTINHDGPLQDSLQYRILDRLGNGSIATTLYFPCQKLVSQEVFDGIFLGKFRYEL